MYLNVILYGNSNRNHTRLTLTLDVFKYSLHPHIIEWDSRLTLTLDVFK